MNLERVTQVELTSHRFTVGQNNKLKNSSREQYRLIQTSI